MSDFHGYEKMPESIQKLGLDLASTKLLNTVDWVVTEKIHGANFSFCFTGEELRYAKRKEYLRWTDDFFGFQIVAERLDNAIMRLFERVRLDHPFASCTIYGELFGGHYPHPDVAPDPRVQAIQTGIHYSPTVEYCVSDIAVTPEAEGAERYYLDYAQVINYCRSSDVPYAQPLFTGKLNQALFMNTRFDSTVPKELGLPAIVPNLVEGIVVKPYRNMVVETPKGPVRPIFKIKNKEFAEEQFHEAQPWSYQHEGASTTERLMFIALEMRRYVTPNRLQNTLSKEGSLKGASTERIDKIREAFLHDAMESFWDANPEFQGDFSVEDLHWLMERVVAEVDHVIQSHTKVF